MESNFEEIWRRIMNPDKLTLLKIVKSPSLQLEVIKKFTIQEMPEKMAHLLKKYQMFIRNPKNARSVLETHFSSSICAGYD
jgi:hypothetical protein